MRNKLNNNSLVVGLIFASAILYACNGTSSSSGNQQTNSVTTTTLSGLAYDPMTKAVFSTNTQGELCKLPVKNIPGNMNCNLTVPNNIMISSQIISDSQGNIYAIGQQTTTAKNFILKYHTQSNTWTTSSVDIPFVLSFNKVLYRQEQLYLADPNGSTLYKINLSNNKIESSADFFVPGPAILEDFDQNGNLFYSYQTNNIDSNFITTSSTSIYASPIDGDKVVKNQFGKGNVDINDLVYVKNTAYACAESNFLYLPSDSDVNSDWKVLTNSAQPNYFSCDYITTDGSNLYYVEGQWSSDQIFSNNYVNVVKAN